MHPPFFIAPSAFQVLRQFEGLETRIITGLSGEQMMMVLSSTLPGHVVPLHAHPHECTLTLINRLVASTPVALNCKSVMKRGLWAPVIFTASLRG